MALKAILNKRAKFEYELIDTYTAGLVLLGSEIKAIRENRASLIDAYCIFEGKEIWVKNMHIAEYKWANQFNHETRRQRKLLLQKGEIKKLHSKVKERGFTIVPLKLYISERGFAKLDIALAKGKKTHDKRQSIKERDIGREMDRSASEYKS
ncbi:MAG: SsrA-binding protein [Limisphaerales bacterium]|jgi:SsrA-binding protein